MDLLIKPSIISGTVIIPTSKSLTHRYFIAASLAHGKSRIANPLFCDDTLYTLKALENLGVKIKKSNRSVEIEGNNGQFNTINKSLYLGDSGTSARLLIGLAVLSHNKIMINGSKRLQGRPNKELLEALARQGVDIDYLGKKYRLPVNIKGVSLKGGKIKISGRVSSQFISSLLFIAPFNNKDTEIEIIDDLKSRPYIDLTIQAMRDFGVNVNIPGNKYKSLIIKSGQKYIGKNIQVEGDYSSASYFIALSYLLGKPIEIKNLNPESKQGDKAIIEMLKKIDKSNKNILDISNTPDIALTLGVIGPFCRELTLIGTDRLITKECNRKQALINNLLNLGAKLEAGRDYIKIYKSKLKPSAINTFYDHRVAMSFAILGTLIPGGVVIKNAEVVNKSYPNFFEDLKKIGVNVTKV